MTTPKIDPAARARLAKMRRDQRVQSAIFAAKAFGPLVVLVAVVWAVTR